MRKGIIKAADDAILPYIFRSLMNGYISNYPNKKVDWEGDLKALSIALQHEMAHIPPRQVQNFNHKLFRASNAINRYFVKNKCSVFKAGLIITEVNAMLDEAILVRQPVQEIFDNTVRFALRDAGIVNDKDEFQDEEKHNQNIINIIESAKKQAPKVLRLLKKQGFFANVEISG